MEKDRSAVERNLDETIEESFPASDPPANTVETGTRVGDSLLPAVVDNRDASRFEVEVNGATAVLTYERRPESIALLHTEVPQALRGRHLADRLAKYALETARNEGRRVIVICPFVKAYLQKHPQND